MGLPKISRGTAIILGIVAAGVLSPIASDARTGSTQTTTITQTYVRTLSGTDFRSLDIDFFPQFLSGTGGGVYAVSNSNTGGTNVEQYFEATVDLPNGAQVIGVSLYIRNCTGQAIAQGYFGAYRPTLGSFAQYATLKVSSGSCATQTVSKTGSPLATVDATTKRYVIGTTVPSTYGSRVTTPNFVLIGARIKWTCTSTCR